MMGMILAAAFIGVQPARAGDPPDWYRLRTDSVPYRPQDITVDATGAVWVTAVNGSEYDPGVWRRPPGKNRFQYLTTSRANNWLAGEFDHVVETDGLDAEVNYVVRDKAGNVWYALNDRTVRCERADGSWQIIHMENTQSGFSDTTNVDSAHTIRLIDNENDTQGVLLIAYTSIQHLDSGFNEVATRSLGTSYPNNELIRDAYYDSHGRYWVANEYGVQFGATLLNTEFPAYSDRYKNDLEAPPYDWNDPATALPVTGIMEDALGNMWFINTSYGAATGVYCLTPPDGTDDWLLYDVADLTGTSNKIICMTPGPNGVMWFAPMYSSGIVNYTPGAATPWTRTTCASLGLESETVLSMREHGGVLWFVTDIDANYGSGVHGWTHRSGQQDPQVVSYEYRETSTTLTSHRIKAMAADLSGGVWFAAYDLPSVARLKADGTWVHYAEDTMVPIDDEIEIPGSIPGIGVDSNNIVYLAPDRRAPLAYDIATETWLDLPAGPAADTNFYNVYVDPTDGKWFLGSERVYHLNADNSAWTTYDTTDTTRFPDYRIQYALMDAEENMWFMSTFVLPARVSVMKKDPAGGGPTWHVFVNGDGSGFLGGPRVYVDRNGDVRNSAGQKYEPDNDTWSTQTDTSLFDSRPLRFLNGVIPAGMDLTGAPEPLTDVNSDLMTVDTRGNVYFSGGTFWLQSINAGIVVRSPVRGDVDRNGRLDLADAVRGAQILTDRKSTVQSHAIDVDGDGRVGTPEMAFVLRRIAGM